MSDAKLSLPAVHFTQPQDVVLLLEDVINGVRSGNMDLKTANCFGYLAGQLSKALEISELGARIEALEKTLAQR